MTKKKDGRRIWFAAKDYGWGWRPVTWQAWAVIGWYLFFLVCSYVVVDSLSHSTGEALILFVPLATLATVLLIVISYTRGERPGWRWGRTKRK